VSCKPILNHTEASGTPVVRLLTTYKLVGYESSSEVKGWLEKVVGIGYQSGVVTMSQKHLG